MEVLTQTELDNLPSGIFKSGTGFIEHSWFNDAKILYNEKGDTWIPVDGKRAPDEGYKYVLINWVAVRGGIADWAIYHSLDANLEPSDYMDGLNHLTASNDRIARLGAKLYNEEKIKEFVPCTQEVLDSYRR